MTEPVDPFDMIRRHMARIKSQTLGSYCGVRDPNVNSSEKCWCKGLGLGGKADADCPPREPPTLEAAPLLPQERALPLLTPVPWAGRRA